MVLKFHKRCTDFLFTSKATSTDDLYCSPQTDSPFHKAVLVVGCTFTTDLGAESELRNMDSDQTFTGNLLVS